MRCRKCGHRWMMIGSTGGSSAPGWFFMAAIAGGLIAWAGYAIREHFDTLGTYVLVTGGVMGAGGLMLCLTSDGDASMYGPPTCPKCKAHVTVWPWSL